ncbi:EscU/YscU/HrcU family type III secretion system export apparatus switch protein [Nocardioides sp. YIM 152315]|uniref:EscU/YscU/HrcU family type III secretion system export apparatus switch protein n=1 Tax=Nocardioides sp. YIM 152315 TaxID=3031760 RepID=UPI0023D97FEA|nr:EscU/YscU/HrcU family type III secretion system export apparatus switch protein [Nocardioides sp. YIM 152315]MDF1605981.1 EscU/YscU/HrcU family type III secretion system export apparatus switch protein [Nocardioides sp. YIM 152315]
MSEEKTEKATPKKNKENRKEGKVPRTQELGQWSALALFALALPKLLGHEITALQEIMTTALSTSGQADVDRALALLGDGLWHVLVASLVLGIGVLLVGVAGALAQGGFYIASGAVKPKLSKLNPLQGFKRMFGMHTLWEGAKMLLRSAIVVFLVWGVVKASMPMIGGLVPVQVVIGHTAEDALGLIRNVAIVGVVLAAADYLVQRKKMGKQTRMTKEEVKQEHKNSEGDPLLKGAIRSRQLAAARNRMMADVPTADVVLVNPTHVAVALRYEPDRGAPRVVARGAGAIAAAIREKASEARVPLVRDVPLARALYGSTTVGQEIPTELFAAVAQVLAFVITRRNQGARGGEHRTPRVESDLPPVSPGGRRPRRDLAEASGPALADR